MSSHQVGQSPLSQVINLLPQLADEDFSTIGYVIRSILAGREFYPFVPPSPQ